jgi:hypothetical protein
MKMTMERSGLWRIWQKNLAQKDKVDNRMDEWSSSDKEEEPKACRYACSNFGKMQDRYGETVVH